MSNGIGLAAGLILGIALPAHATGATPTVTTTVKATSTVTATSIPAAGPTAAQLAERVQKHYEKSTDLTADVEQRYRYAAAGRTLMASGSLLVRKPGLLRWTVKKPSLREFVIDGKTLSVYDAEDATVLVREDFSAESMPAAVSFLWGAGNLVRDFDVKLASRPKDGPHVIELVPRRPQPGFQRLFFAVDPATGQVQVSTVVDHEGNENRLAFSNVRVNTGLAADRFRFVPPPGTTVQKR